MRKEFLSHISDTLHEIESAGLYKLERQIISPQAGRINVNLMASDMIALSTCVQTTILALLITPF